jgi:cytochrome P450
MWPTVIVMPLHGENQPLSTGNVLHVSGTVVLVTAVEFDPFSSTYFDDPYDTYRRLRNEAPVFRSERYGFYALSRYDDVVAAHKDWGTFSSARGVDLMTLSTDGAFVAGLRNLIMMDPPAHDRFRTLVSRVFTPKAMQAMEPLVRRIVGHYVDEIGDRSTFDAVGELSGPFPIEIISELLGVPPGDRQQIRHWLDAMLHREPGEMRPTDAGIDAAINLGVYWLQLVETKRAEPADDLTTRLVEVEVDRGDGVMTALDDGEVAGFAGLLVGAGAETVTKLVANAFVLFHRHPDQWDKVRNDPGRIPAAVEEILRFWPPSQYQGRFSMAASTFHDTSIPPGHPVLLLTGSATRDERFYDRPDEFDVDREPGMALGFGLGIHSCLGAALARVESRVVIEAMIDRWSSFTVDESALERVQMSNVAGFKRVPVRVRS